MASENGWEPLHPNAGQLEWVTVPGTAVHLQFLKGWPSAILRAFAADFNAYIEPLRDADSAGYTATNSVATSNHLNGTAMDLNWNSHPFRVLNAGFDAAKIATARELLDWYEDTVWWGNDWNSPKDAMHWNMSYNTYNNPRLGDFIARKIRADGFSTFRRGSTPEPSSTAADVLARATGISFAKATAVLPLVSFALVKGNCTNPRRIAAALAQWVVESGHFVYTEEIADGPESDERWKYKGRTWIQLTWLENYSGFSKWCNSLGLVPTPDYFVVRPHELADQKWAALGPAYWWAIKYPRINEYADRGDIDNVSKWVNAPAWVDNPSKHANGEQARRDAYNLALALGDQLLTLTQQSTGVEDDMASVPQDQWDRVYRELTQRLPSRSPFRYLNQDQHYQDGLVDTVAGFDLNIDGMTHVQYCEVLAGYGHPPTLALLREVAGADPSKYPDRQDDAQLAQAVLARVTAKPTVNAVAVGNMAPQVVYRDIPTPPIPAESPTAGAGSTGQLTGAAIDALAALQHHVSELPPEAIAPLGDLVNILKKGAA